MTHPAVSVIVVTRHRPDELHKCLRALLLQTYPNFEIVVVGDPGIKAVIESLNLQDSVKQSLFDESNISEARNIGIDAAGGDIVAFIDDDAVAEPTWLMQLIGPFDHPAIAAAGGYVRGRNGISYQWRGEVIDASGQPKPIELAETQVFEGRPDSAVKTHGVNCAFRRDVLTTIGGFDENYKYYLDDSDLNMRISKAGHQTAIVPGAEVQHGFAKSARRSADRTPLDLFEIGASQAYFIQKFGGEDAHLNQFLEAQRRRLVRLMVSGELSPDDVPKLMRGLRSGIEDGQARHPKTRTQFGQKPAFFPLSVSSPAEHMVFYANWSQRRAAFSKARDMADAGASVTVMVFSKTSLFHRRWFHRNGFWVQTGGQFGKSIRDDPYFARVSAPERAERERKLVSKARGATIPALPIVTQSP